MLLARKKLARRHSVKKALTPNLKAKIGEERGQMILRFDVRNISQAVYLSQLMSFTERLSDIRDEKSNEKTAS